jgi:hypothetical protein
MHTIDKMSIRFCSSPTKESVKSWHKQLRLLFFSWNGKALEYGKKSMKKLRSYTLKLKHGNCGDHSPINIQACILACAFWHYPTEDLTGNLARFSAEMSCQSFFPVSIRRTVSIERLIL